MQERLISGIWIEVKTSLLVKNQLIYSMFGMGNYLTTSFSLEHYCFYPCPE